MRIQYSIDRKFSDGLVRAVQLLPNSLLGVLGGHDGFPVEALGWSAGRKMLGSVSHDEYIRLWVSYGVDCVKEETRACNFVLCSSNMSLFVSCCVCRMVHS